MRVIAIVMIVGAAIAADARAQVRDRAAPPAAAPASDAATLAAGWTALATGRHDEAARQAETILQRRRWDRAALLLKISALSAASSTRGLDSYEQWLGSKRPDDITLIEPIAIAALQEIAAAADPQLRRDALDALVGARVPGARERLDALAGTNPDLAAQRDAAAARAGDAAALQRLNAAAESAAADPRASGYLANALAQLGSSGEPGLLLLAKAGNPQSRVAATKALGSVKTEASRGALLTLEKDPDPLVRLWATVSRARGGDDEAMVKVEQMLQSPAPDVQIAASQAWEGRPGPWVEVLRPLLANPDGVVRLHAAQALAPVDPDSARRVLDAALTDPNPVVRLESASAIDAILERQPYVLDLPSLRQRLRDRDPHVRLTVAGALLKLARSS